MADAGGISRYNPLDHRNSVSLSSGTRLGPYEILTLIGAGGMGEVYRARDSRLNRDVAVKLLPDVFANDPDRLARFQREAQVLAALNHPNIAHVYGLEEANSTRALVMELVEGPTLADRIAQGPVPLDEALPIARQIAEALEAAHEQGIIHRDLKPANIKVRDDGAVKVLDFGLAKLIDPAAAGSSSNPSVTASPTITTPAMMTGVGVILGTAAYMSPEQAKGRPADKRSDVWAFGCVLYEMLTGRRPFEGEDVSDTLAAVLRAEVNWTALPPGTPPSVQRLLRRCIERDRTRRLHSAADARIEIDDAPLEPQATTSLASPVLSRKRERFVWISATVSALAVVVAVEWTNFRPMPPPPETRLEVSTPAADDPTSFAISPDGKQLVFAATEHGATRLWLRSLDSVSPQVLEGTEGAESPFWSPDSRSIAFFAVNKLKRLDIGGGAPRDLASLPFVRGGSWGPDGVILLGVNAGALLRIPATGGQPTQATKLTERQNLHRFPHFLPGSRQFLFSVRGQERVAGLYLGSLDSPQGRRLTAADSSGFLVAPNWIIFLRQGTLTAQRFDASRTELVGDPIAIADQVPSSPNAGAAPGGGAFSVSAGGVIAYRAGGATVTQLTWFDRSGKTLGFVGERDINGLQGINLSPDGTRVTADRTVQNNRDVWLFDQNRAIRFTSDSTVEAYSTWSPDGSRIAFAKNTGGTGTLEIYTKPSNGSRREERVLASSRYNIVPMSWSADGRFLIYLERNAETAGDLWVLPMDGQQKPYAFVTSKFEERTAQFSPDGHWVAYASDESGRFEVYLRPFPGPGGQWPLSTAGGVTPRWRRDGKEIFYLAPDGMLMATSISGSAKGPTLGQPMPLFQPHALFGGTTPVGTAFEYDVAPDGRFLVNVDVRDTTTAPITIVQNWRPRS